MNLVVADVSRTEKTICLAVTPALKAYGIPGRARLFEVEAKIKEINAVRRKQAPGGILSGSSHDSRELSSDPSLALSYIAAPPRMAHYMEVSSKIYEIYLRYVAPEDIHVYSIDEVFIDATAYLKTYGKTAREFTQMLIRAVLAETGITATAGIGPNLYLAKIAMDIEAKHIPADRDGVRIAELDEMSYRYKLWTHKPLTDFWRVGPGYRTKLEANGMYTMGDVARMSVSHEDLLYKLFGVNAELLIDHAWGWEPCTIAEIKAFKPETNSVSSGQVLGQPYPFDKAKLIVREMTDLLILDLVEKRLVTDQMVLTVCYDTENLTDPERKKKYRGAVTLDRYGRAVPKDAHGSQKLPCFSSSTKVITEAVMELYDRIVNPALLVRRIYVIAENTVPEDTVKEKPAEQLDLFTDYETLMEEREKEQKALAREKSMQKTLIGIHNRFGKNAILRGMNFEEGATTRERNEQVGGHKA